MTRGSDSAAKRFRYDTVVPLRKVGLLQDREDTLLAGRMTALLGVYLRLPDHLWYEADAQA
jgi:hypothetical protein